MNRFLQGETIECIAWLEKKDSKAMLTIRPNYYIRLIIIPFTVAGFIIYKGLGFESIMRIFISKDAPTSIIPFQDAAKYFSIHPLKYFASTIFAGIVDALRAMNVLL